MFRQVRTLISEWLDGLTKDCQALDQQDILARLSGGQPLDLYKPGEVWVEQALFNPVLKQIQVICRVAEPHYTTRAIGHVAAEQLTRCYSQSCFLLGILLHQSGGQMFDETMNVENFIYAGDEGRFRRPEPTGHPFTFTVSLDKVAKIEKKAAFYFSIKQGSKRGTALCYYAPDGSGQELQPNLYDSLHDVWQSAWAELPKFKLNVLRLLATAISRKHQPLPVPTTV